jgi:hypothetical protein
MYDKKLDYLSCIVHSIQCTQLPNKKVYQSTSQNIHCIVN